ncbi:MAG: GNAT family N-acetyltransferase [Gammaproteobacteria bacterium]|nr:GNAT family N-acetyltransferase [Gammaproteobacteria bacterium]MDH5309985.1 GNAT family N-acetyltransferase [Gammaproteobacteria bacterium]
MTAGLKPWTMAESPEFRRATLADLECLVALARRTFLEAYSELNQPEYMNAHVQDAFSRDSLRELLNSDDTITLLATAGGRPVAYAQLCRESPCPGNAAGPSMELMRIYVDSTVQGAGIGAGLLRESISLAKKTGHQSLWLQVWDRNPRARRFYERHGFEAVGATSFMLGPERQSDIVMALALAGAAGSSVRGAGCD